MRPFLVSLLIITINISSLNAQTGMLSANFPNEKLADCLILPGEIHPVPKAYTSFWSDSISKELCHSYISYGESYLNKPWSILPAKVFAEFKNTGNRTHYESLCFERRRQLAALSMAEIVEGKGRFLDDIIDGLEVMCEETWWGIPAHYSTPYPTPEDQTVDLFNAETASLIAWIKYMLSDSLEARSAVITKRIDDEIDRRILRPALNNNYWWKTAGMNWNPWICSNWLTCVLFCERDRNRQIDAVSQILSCMDVFLDSYPDDGGCDEGPGYWDRAAASLYECIQLLDIATNGRISLRKNSKFRAMGSYAFKSYIGNGYSVNFADAHDNKSLLQVNILYPFAVYLDDDQMKGLAKSLWNGDSEAANTYDNSGNFPTLGRELMFLRVMSQFSNQKAIEPNIRESWMPNLQIMTARDGKHLFTAMKGGHNDESHNHNDVGNFIVYVDNEPLIIDAGVGEYTSKTFSKSRYDIWTMQSNYHNVPVINGFAQNNGREYKAVDVVHSQNTLAMDISKAYPKEAAVNYWKREVSLLRGKCVRVTESFDLKEYKSPTLLHLITPEKPNISRNRILLGKHVIEIEGKNVEIGFEDISTLMDNLLFKMWDGPLYRIIITLNQPTTHGKICYRIY